MKILRLCALFFLASILTHAQMPMGGVTVSYSGGGGSPAIVQPTTSHPLNAACAEYNSGAAVTCAYPVNVTAGNEAYVLVMAGGAGTIGTPSCASGTATIGTFTAVGSGGSVGSGAQQWYRAAITGSGSCTITETFSATTNVGVFPFEVSNDGGADTGTNPVYHAVSSSFCSSSCAMGSITPATTSDLILAAFMAAGTSGSTYTVTPYTLSGSGPGSVGNDINWLTANYTAPSTSTISPTFTPSSAFGGQTYWDSSLAIK